MFCRAFKKDREKNKGKEVRKEDMNDDDLSNVIDEFNIVYDDDFINLITNETSWVIDSGATIHATCRREFFSSYTPGNFGVVKMGNNLFSKGIDKGDVCLIMENGTRLVLRDVRHIADMHLNLISVSRLDDEGLCSTFKDGKWKLTKGSMVMARGLKCFMLYVMHAKISTDVVNAVEKDNTAVDCLVELS